MSACVRLGYKRSHVWRMVCTKQIINASVPCMNILCANFRNNGNGSFSAIIKEYLPAVGCALSFGVGGATGYRAGQNSHEPP